MTDGEAKEKSGEEKSGEEKTGRTRARGVACHRPKVRRPGGGAGPKVARLDAYRSARVSQRAQTGSDCFAKSDKGVRLVAQSIQDVLRGFAGLFDRLEDVRDADDSDPLSIVDAMLGSRFVRTDNAYGEQWWELFGLDAKPATQAELDGAWRRWAARNHPDAGGNEPQFRFMRRLFETMRDRTPE